MPDPSRRGMILMIATTLGLALLLGSSATAGGHGQRVPVSDLCQFCGVDGRATLPLIAQLQSAPRWQMRDNAAHALRKFDWRRHPEVVYALCDAMLLDPKDDVRAEAAESLKEMRPCVPVAHEALRRAARDRDDDVREEARDALRSLKRRCVADCGVCGPIPAGVVIQGPGSIPDPWLPLLAPMPGAVPFAEPGADQGLAPMPGELPPALPEEAPPYPGAALEPLPEGPLGGMPL